MYWIPKMHKIPASARFIIASKICSTKQISKSVSNVYKLVKNAKFLSDYNKFRVLQNCDPIIQSLNNIKKGA